MNWRERDQLAKIRRAMRAFDDAPTHETHPMTEDNEFLVLVEGCPRCEAISTIWANATDWIAFLLTVKR